MYDLLAHGTSTPMGRRATYKKRSIPQSLQAGAAESAPCQAHTQACSVHALCLSLCLTSSQSRFHAPGQFLFLSPLPGCRMSQHIVLKCHSIDLHFPSSTDHSGELRCVHVLARSAGQRAECRCRRELILQCKYAQTQTKAGNSSKT